MRGGSEIGPAPLASKGRVLTSIRLLAIALPLYFAWEMLQMPAFTGLPESVLRATAWCALATLGDGVLVVVVFVIAAVLFADRCWFAPPRPGRYVVAVFIGVLLNVAAESLLARGAGLWGYAPWQPVVPVVNVGALAVVQPVILLPLSFSLLARWDPHAERSHEHSLQQRCPCLPERGAPDDVHAEAVDDRVTEHVGRVGEQRRRPCDEAGAELRQEHDGVDPEDNGKHPALAIVAHRSGKVPRIGVLSRQSLWRSSLDDALRQGLRGWWEPAPSPPLRRMPERAMLRAESIWPDAANVRRGDHSLESRIAPRRSGPG